MRRHTSWSVLLAAALVLPLRLGAQTPAQTRMLRDAAGLEAQGDFEGAERVLRSLLTSDPSSSGGLFALERVLREKGAVATLLPAVDTFLAHDPDASGVRYMKLRVLLEVDSLDGLEQAAEQWFRAEPGSEVPYREVSRVFEKAFGAQRALEVLRRGRSATGHSDALALEMADLLVATGDAEGAVKEWTRAVGDDGAGAGIVAKRVGSLPQGSREAGRRLVSALSGARESGRRRAAAGIALDLGLEAEALRASREVVKGMDARSRDAFLTDIAGRARTRGLAELSAWAYEELGRDASSPGERREIDRRLVEASLARGDTSGAVEAQRRVVASLTPGSADRRKATALAIRLEIPGSDRAGLRRLLDGFRSEFPEAPETDALAASVAAGLVARGDATGAAAVMEGVDGPRTALERGYLLLGAGDVPTGRAALLMAVNGLDAVEATGVIQYAGLLGRLSEGGTRLLTRAGLLAHGGRGGEAARLLETGSDSVAASDRPALLAEAARMADAAGDDSVAAGVRDRLLSEHPDAPEVPEASLALARYRARTPAGHDEAVRLLTGLLTEHPNAAVAPDARRELNRLRRGGGP
jgi:tetratricopeptide (TPR) repeat protein